MQPLATNLADFRVRERGNRTVRGAPSALT